MIRMKNFLRISQAICAVMVLILPNLGCKSRQTQDSQALTEASGGRCKLYVDMDAVLTDFIRQYRIKSKGGDFYKDTDDSWKNINYWGKSFWVEMPWMKDGEALWRGIKNYNPSILTSCGKVPSNGCIEGKKAWVRNKLGPYITVIIDYEKFKYARPGDLLIDDMVKNTSAWEKSKGIPIEHKQTVSTLATLNRYDECLRKIENFE